jgi:hypothetical protein
MLTHLLDATAPRHCWPDPAYRNPSPIAAGASPPPRSSSPWIPVTPRCDNCPCTRPLFTALALPHMAFGVRSPTLTHWSHARLPRSPLAAVAASLHPRRTCHKPRSFSWSGTPFRIASPCRLDYRTRSPIDRRDGVHSTTSTGHLTGTILTTPYPVRL